MRIQVIESSTKRPLQNATIQLQVRGSKSGFVTATSDASGTLQLDDNKVRDQEIAALLKGKPGQWIKATDGAKLYVNTEMKVTGKEKSSQTTGSNHR